jgi:hypothetical protein
MRRGKIKRRPSKSRKRGRTTANHLDAVNSPSQIATNRHLILDAAVRHLNITERTNVAVVRREVVMLAIHDVASLWITVLRSRRGTMTGIIIVTRNHEMILPDIVVDMLPDTTPQET